MPAVIPMLGATSAERVRENGGAIESTAKEVR